MQPQITCVILAGGRGERMGGDIPKPLAQVGGKSMLARVYDAVRQVPNASVGLVQPPGANGFGLGGFDWQITQDRQRGLPDALLRCRDAVTDADVLLVTPCDKPFLDPLSLRDIVAWSRNEQTRCCVMVCPANSWLRDNPAVVFVGNETGWAPLLEIEQMPGPTELVELPTMRGVQYVSGGVYALRNCEETWSAVGSNDILPQAVMRLNPVCFLVRWHEGFNVNTPLDLARAERIAEVLGARSAD